MRRLFRTSFSGRTYVEYQGSGQATVLEVKSELVAQGGTHYGGDMMYCGENDTVRASSSMTEPRMKLDEIANAVGGILHGEPALEVTRIRPLEDAVAGDLSFFAPSSSKNAQSMQTLARQTSATALLVVAEDSQIKAAQIVVKNPMGAIIHLASRYFDRSSKPEPGVHPTAVIGRDTALAPGVRIGAYAVIGERVTIGENTIIHPHAVLYDDVVVGADCVIHAGVVIRERTVLGDDCLIQNGAVLGSDGFGYIPDPQLGHRRIPHIGSLTLENRVDVGANTAIDRATLGTSVLGEASKIDNLVQIGHNAKIGKRVILCGQVGIAGSCEIGNDVIFGGAVGLADHVQIGSKVRASARTGISNSVPDGTDVAGYPHKLASEWRREAAALRRLPEIFAEVRSLRRQFAELKAETPPKSK